MKTIALFLLLFTILSVPGRTQERNIPKQYISASFGHSTGPTPGQTLNVALNTQFELFYYQLRSTFITDHENNRFAWDVGATAGVAFENRIGILSLSSGINFAQGSRHVGNDKVDKYKTVGVPIQSSALMKITHRFGIGPTIIYNYNSVRPSFSFLGTFALGYLGSQ